MAPAFKPLKVSPSHSPFSRQMDYVRQFSADAGSWDATSERPVQFSVPFFRAELEKAACSIFDDPVVWRLEHNPYGVCGALNGKTSKAILRGCTTLYNIYFPDWAKPEVRQAINWMDFTASLPASEDGEQAENFVDHYVALVEPMRRALPASSADIGPLFIVAHYDSWVSHLTFRELDKVRHTPSKRTARLTDKLETERPRAIASVQKLRQAFINNLQRRTPASDREEFIFLTNELQLMGQDLDLPRAVKALKQRTEATDYFNKAARANEILPWSEGEARHALSIAALINDKTQMHYFGERLLQAYERALQPRYGASVHVPRDLPVFELTVPLFQGGQALADASAFANYMRHIHPDILKKFRASQPTSAA